ncbi:MAG: transcriptional regulator FtrA [Actinomycetota bacterium]|nr:transcriptional regulator FtrA [Actinomycetota bacterium]
MHLVVTAVGTGPSLFEIAVACEVFGLDRSELVDPWYVHRVAAASPPPLVTPEGLVLETPYGLEQLALADTIIIPGWRFDTYPPSEDLLEGLRAAHRRGARLLSVCSGAFVLAAAGLLDGRRATTHWMYASELARRYPKIDVNPRVLYVDEGEILTSAGTAAGIDLMLHVVRQDHGAEVANAVARRMVVPPHRDGGQAQFVDVPVPAGPGNGDTLAEVLDWMAENLDQPLTVEQLAHKAAMSPRTFARRFRAATGTTPRHWLLSQRVMLAQRLLETTDESVEHIASLCGFGSAAGLRAHFQREVSTSPLAYRSAFRQA